MNWWQQPWVRRTVAWYVLWRLWLWVVSFFSWQWMPIRQGYLGFEEFPTLLPNFIAAWGNFDGAVFMRIARGGYGTSEVPFFPLLPMIMSPLHNLTGLSLITSGLIISLVSFLAALVVLKSLTKLDAPNLPWLLFLAVLLTFPTGHYFTAVYQDALFLLLASSTVWFARTHRWKWAILAAMAAMLARLNGIALMVYLAFEYWLLVSPQLVKKWGFTSLAQEFWQPLKPVNLFKKQRWVWALLLIPLVFVGYLGYIHLRFGDWHLFFDGVQVWNRDKLTFPLQTFWRYFKILILYPSPSFIYWVAWAEGLFTALYGIILLWGWGRMRLSYWWWMLAHLTIPIVTGTLQGMPRYGLHLYPLFLVLALWVNKLPRWAQILYFGTALILQAVYVAFFVTGYFVA